MTDLTREGLVELAAKVEQASGPDRELDILIAHAVHPFLSTGIIGPEQIRDECPEFTASLDAAMTLIPEGRWYWAVKNYPNAQCAADIGGIYIGVGATPALALCAAALTARARAMEAGRG